MYRHASAYRTVVRYGMQRIASLHGVPTPLKAIRTIQSNGAVATSRMKLASMPSRPFTSTAPFSSASTDTSVPSVSSVSNPLLDSIASGDSRHFPLPRFSHIQPEHIRQLVDTFIPDMLAQFEAYEASLTRALASSSSSSSTLTYAKVIPPLVHLTDRMNYVFGTIDHLAAVKDTPPLREAVQAIQEERVKLNIRFGQSKPIYQALQQLSQHQQAQHLSPVQMKIIQDMLLESHLSGVGLEGSSKDLFSSYLQRLSALSTSFAHHLLDAKVGLTVTDPRVMVGIPENMRALYALHARTSEPKIECATSENGPWRIGLSGVHFVPFMTHCSSRNHRELLYKAYITRASMYDGNDNRPILSEILLLRHSMSQLLGFPTYAHQSLATKMVNDPNEVEEFLEKLYQIALPKTRDDFNELQEFAYKNGLPRSSTLQSYDVAYYSDRLAKLKFNFDSEALRPYLPFDHVLNGLWQLVESLFHVRIVEHDPSEVGPGRKIDTWHTDVKYFDVYRLDPSTKERGPLIAGFYVDAYSRPSEKRGGAWMGECIGRAAVATAGADSKEVRLPVAFLICNQQPPTNGKPSQLSFDEMTTLFHEFGHVSQHILTTVGESSVAGIRGVEWDAVELASQFLENFCYDTQVLKTITKHVDTGASIPQELLDALLQSRNFRSASALMRQIQFATLDMKLHHTGVAPAMKKENTKEQQSGEITPDAIAGVMPLIAQVERSVSDKCSVLPFDPQNKFLNSFSHIWAGGYSAGYYSYKWAEVMSCDAYEAFMELVDPRDSYETRLAKWSKLGLKYRATVLELGGSVKAKEVFRQFRGRDPSITPLLKQAGLIEEEKKQ